MRAQFEIVCWDNRLLAKRPIPRLGRVVPMHYAVKFAEKYETICGGLVPQCIAWTRADKTLVCQFEAPDAAMEKFRTEYQDKCGVLILPICKDVEAVRFKFM